MLPSNKKITAWIEEGKQKGALELLVGLDTYFLTPVGAEPQDDDYFEVFVMPGENHNEVMKKAFKDPHCHHEATYKVPQTEEELGRFGAQHFQTCDTGHFPTYLVNNLLYPNRFGRRGYGMPTMFDMNNSKKYDTEVIEPLRQRKDKTLREYGIPSNSNFCDVCSNLLCLIYLTGTNPPKSGNEELNTHTKDAFDLYLRMVEESPRFRSRESQSLYLVQGFDSYNDYVTECARRLAEGTLGEGLLK